VGSVVGMAVGTLVGRMVGVVGKRVGRVVGSRLGNRVGNPVGSLDGSRVGVWVGATVGLCVGAVKVRASTPGVSSLKECRSRDTKTEALTSRGAAGNYRRHPRGKKTRDPGWDDRWNVGRDNGRCRWRSSGDPTWGVRGVRRGGRGCATRGQIRSGKREGARCQGRHRVHSLVF
jgi:hypothetical protein